MKKIILIPLLILLVGCETETELDRCIEANTTDGFFDYDQWSKKHEDYLVKRKIAGENSPLLERGSIWDSIDKIKSPTISRAFLFCYLLINYDPGVEGVNIITSHSSDVPSPSVSHVCIS